jgi:hypothetical protein
MLKKRLETFNISLIKEAKTDSLLHGLLSFFKHLFNDFKIDRNDLSKEEFI